MNKNKRWFKVLSLFLASLSLTFLLAGCGSFNASDGEQLVKAMTEALQEVKSVETSITLDIQGRFSNSSLGSEDHTAAVNSTATIESSFSPNAIHGQYYSSILVDGAVSREERECYIVPNGSDHVRYDYVASSGEWTQSKVLRTDALTIPRRTGLIYDWSDFMKGLSYDQEIDGNNDRKLVVFSGEVNKAVLEELLGNNVFGTFLYSMEWLMEDMIPCTFYVDAETAYPDHFELDFSNSFITSDMSFTLADITVSYSNWDKIETIEAPKRVTVVSTNPDAEFYSSYYAWNLFLPYIGGQVDGSVSGQDGQSFAATWTSFQVRIDGGMTSIPLPYSDLEKAGYTFDDKYSSLIMEPNKYKEGVVLCKGKDKLTVTVYNDDTVAQPVTSCKICCLDYAAGQIPNNGIKIYFPGEVTLGITKEALLSAYGDADEETSAFACDTYIWNGESEAQSLLAEVSPITGQVIRLKVTNIPVSGGEQK